MLTFVFMLHVVTDDPLGLLYLTCLWYAF